MQSNALILLAEDDEHDVFFFRRALSQSGLTNPLIAVEDGQEAVDYLAGNGLYADRASHPLPDLLLLDLKMPRMNGFDVLAWLSSQPKLKELSVVVLSSSAQESDIEKARVLGADEYHVEPQDYEQLVEIIRKLHESVAGQCTKRALREVCNGGTLVLPEHSSRKTWKRALMSDAAKRLFCSTPNRSPGSISKSSAGDQVSSRG